MVLGISRGKQQKILLNDGCRPNIVLLSVMLDNLATKFLDSAFQLRCDKINKHAHFCLLIMQVLIDGINSGAATIILG